jgi:ketosteroid isomerase-like protein
MRIIVLAAAVLAAAPALAQTADVAPVVAAERAFAADFPAMGLAGSFQKWGRPDAILINGGQAQEIAAVFQGAPLTRQPAEPLIEWWPTFAGVAKSGELGFTTGPAARDQEGYGHYFTIWRRQPDGAWRWVYDGGSNASPAGQQGRDSEPRILLAATVGSASPEAAMTEVRAVEAALAVAAAADQKAAHLAALAADGRLYVAPLAPAEGPDAFARALDGWPERFDFGATEGGGASDAGDMAWTYGPAAWTREGQARTGHYMRLWQKRPEGWKLIMAQLIPAPINPPPPADG